MLWIVFRLLYMAVRLLSLAILLYCILSWFARPGNGSYDLYRRMGYYLEPLFVPARKLLYKLNFNLPIDLAPWLTMILLDFIYQFVASILIGFR